MRRQLAVLTLAILAGACAGDTTAPREDANVARLGEMAGFAYGATRVGDPGNDFMERLARLTGPYALTAAQTAQINALHTAFVSATAADRAALAAIMKEAADARAAGRTAEEVRAILATGSAARTRLHEAEHALRAAILAVLTPAQRALLSGHTPREPGPCATITEAQRNEISALRAAFETANATDIAAIRSAHERARAAHASGATRAQVATILAEARAAMERVAAAHVALHAAVAAVLTPEQRAAGCLGIGGPRP